MRGIVSPTSAVRLVGRIAFNVCVVLLRRRQKQQAVFGTAVATCHPEQVRSVVVMATMETFFRTRRSFAEKKRRLRRSEQNRDLR